MTAKKISKLKERKKKRGNKEKRMKEGKKQWQAGVRGGAREDESLGLC